MATLNSVHVKKTAEEDAELAALRSLFPAADVDKDADYLGAMLPNDAFIPPEPDLLALSARFQTDVIWLCSQRTVDAFQFFHWRDGKLLRALVYGAYREQGTWERVVGEPEPWEAQVLFKPEVLATHLSFAGSDEERQELQRIWSQAEIVAGRFEPSLDAEDCALQVAEIYGLPLG